MSPQDSMLRAAAALDQLQTFVRDRAESEREEETLLAALQELRTEHADALWQARTYVQETTHVNDGFRRRVFDDLETALSAADPGGHETRQDPRLADPETRRTVQRGLRHGFAVCLRCLQMFDPDHFQVCTICGGPLTRTLPEEGEASDVDESV